MIVELIYDADCPNVPHARSQLIKAFTQTGVSARWKEWERSAPDAPGYARDYGSPTILVDGKDLAGVAPNAGTRACRVYSDERGNLSRTPSIAAICSALLAAAPRKKPIAGCAVCEDTIALINKITCPSCEVEILDMHKPEVSKKAKQYGIRSIPAVVVDGKLADCCVGRGPDERQMRAAGIGIAL